MSGSLDSDVRDPRPVSSLAGAASSPWLWGSVLTVAFYAAIPYLPLEREFVARYFCGHWIEYATTAAFFLGMATLGRKALALPREFATLKLDLLADPKLREPAAPAEIAHRLATIESHLPVATRRSVLAERVRDVCRYVASSGVESLDGHLRYLADLSADRLHASYAFVRTVTWAIPILGFLGTVIGITMAIAGVSETTSLTEVAGGLAVAFDTTALSLSLSMVLVFATAVVERTEQGVLSRVEDWGINQLALCLPKPASSRSPLVEAETQAAQQLLKQTEGLVAWQTGLWQKALEDMRSRWVHSAEQQQSQLESALQQGMARTLSDHAMQLAEIRGELLSCFRTVSQDLSTAVGGWHEDLSHATKAMTDQLHELSRQGEILQGIVSNEEQLVRLQATLQHNLQTVKALETLEETVHSLSAAIHLLTARTRLNAA